MSPLNNQPKSVFDKINIGKIGQGRLYTEGQWRKTMGSGPADRGMKGQLKALQRSGRHMTTKNLSDKNIKQIHSLISDRIKNKVAGTGNYLSREDKMAIVKESRKLAQTKGSNFTYEDRKDAMKIVDVLRRQGKEAVFQRANNTDKTLPSNQQSSIRNKNIILGNGVDTLRQHGNGVIGAGSLFPQKNSRIAGDKLPQNIASANRISTSRQTAQSNDAKNKDNIVDEQRENGQEEKTYGFIDATGEEVKLN